MLMHALDRCLTIFLLHSEVVVALKKRELELTNARHALNDRLKTNDPNLDGTPPVLLSFSTQ